MKRPLEEGELRRNDGFRDVNAACTRFLHSRGLFSEYELLRMRYEGGRGGHTQFAVVNARRQAEARARRKEARDA